MDTGLMGARKILKNKSTVTLVLVFFIAVAYIFELKNASGKLFFTFNTSVVMVLFLIVAALLLSHFGRISLNRSTGFVLLLWFILFLLALLSGLWSEYPELVIKRALLIFTPSILITFIVFMDQEAPETFHRVTSFLAWLGFFLALYGLIIRFAGNFLVVDGISISQIKFGPLALGQRIYGNPPLWRISSLKGNPNSLALVLLASIWATYVQFAADRMKRPRYYIWMSVQLLALSLTFSRTGIGATVLMCPLFYFFSAKKTISWISKAIAIVFLALLIILIVMPLIPQGVISALQDRVDVGLNAREGAWLPITASIMDKPVGGVGFAVVDEAVLLPVEWVKGAHNVHLTVLSEMGLPGYTVFLLLWFYGIVLGIYWGSSQFNNCEDRLILLSSGVLLASLLFHQFFEDSLMRICALQFLWVYLIAVIAMLPDKIKSKAGINHWNLKE